jgi:hypothetical protein
MPMYGWRKPTEPDTPTRTRVAELEVTVDELSELTHALLARVSELEKKK